MPKETSLPVDDSVTLPPSVRRAAKAAEKAHAAAYADPAPPPDPAAPAQVDPAVPAQVDPAVPAQVDPAPQPAPAPQPEPAPSPELAPQPDPAPQSDNWEHRYYSMKGRYDQSQSTIGSMQEQMRDLGNELMRTQQLVRQPAQQSPNPQTSVKLLTPEDESNYGTELIDVVKRAAQEAINPQLTKLERENQQLRQSVTKSAQAGVHQTLSAAVPDWEAINVNPRFHNWLRLPDLYSGHVRGQMLKQAFQAADAPRVIAFFKGFIADEVAAGQIQQAPQQQPAPTPPRTAAVSLDTLVAPGRARPAPGEQSGQSPDAKPVFTRGQISNFYTQVRQGVFEGNVKEKDKIEQSIFRAQAEGRVRG
jgi:hypothetical protein